MIKKITGWLPLTLLSVLPQVQTMEGAEDTKRWSLLFDAGGVIPEDVTVTEFDHPVSGNQMKLDAGFQFDLGFEYHVQPWLRVGPEFGFTFNYIDSIAGWSYPDSTLGNILMMANVRIQYPPSSRFSPFAGGGVGGVASFLTFGDNYNGGYYYYYEPDGTASDFSLGLQAFAGLTYRVNNNINIGVVYRYLIIDRQHWDVHWWNGGHFGISVDPMQMHSICLVLTGDF